MTEKDSKKRLVGPWRSVHAAIWLIGLAVLAIFDWWWPGILVLVAISGLYEAYLRRNVTQAYEAEPPKVPESQTVDDIGAHSPGRFSCHDGRFTCCAGAPARAPAPGLSQL